MNKLLLGFILLPSLSFAATVTLQSSSDFDKNTAELSKCYISSQANCGNNDMSGYYWSDDPNAYWSDVNSNLSSSNSWSSDSGSDSFSAPMPSDSSSHTDSDTTNQQPTYNTPVFSNQSDEDSDSNSGDDSSGGFIIS